MTPKYAGEQTHKVITTWEQAAEQAFDDLLDDTARTLFTEPLEALHQIAIEIGYGPLDTPDWSVIAAHAIDHYDAIFRPDFIQFLAGKQRDYGHQNILAYGTVGVKVRISDKVARLTNLIERNAEGVNETIQDTWADILGYALIGKMLDNGTFELPLEEDQRRHGGKLWYQLARNDGTYGPALEHKVGQTSQVSSFFLEEEGGLLTNEWVESITVYYTSGDSGSFWVGDKDNNPTVY